MLKEQARLLNRLTIAVDQFLIILAFFVAYYIRKNFLSGDVTHWRDYIWVLFPALPVWYYFLAKQKLYKSIRHIGFLDLFLRVFTVHVFAGIVLSAFILYFDRDFYSRRLLMAFVVTSFSFIIIGRVFQKGILSLIRRHGLNYRELLIIGTKERAQEFIKMIESHVDWGLRVVGIIQVDLGELKDNVSGYPVMGRLEDLIKICKGKAIDEVVFCPSKDQVVDIERHLQELEEIGVTVRMVLDFYKLDYYKRDLSFFGDRLPIMTFHVKSLDTQQYLVKRVMDIVGALLGLSLLVILYPMIAVVIKIESKGPVFYSQKRVGINGRRFRIWKFRTMYANADLLKKNLADQNEMRGAFFKIKNDPRVTLFGKLLRVTSLDEIPQFWNVLVGDMSLVGTRPPTANEVLKYENWHHRRIIIKPGITGLWQVSGRNEIKKFDDVVKLDLQYIDNWTLALDFRILLKTVWVVLTGKGSA